MKQRIILLAFILLGLNASAQTLNVKKDNVVYQFPAAQAADMWYTDGKTLTIMDKAFTLSELTKMYVDFSTVTDNQVDVAYNGGSATVYIAGNIAQYVDATEASGHVVVNQLSNVGDDTCGEITYHLSGSCSDGQFYMTGSYKASVELDGLTLTNPNGAAINIQNGKRISVSVKKDTENTLTDGSGNADKGCFVCKGHTELKGKGVLNVKSLAACAIWSKEYIEMKNCTVNVTGAAKDGVNCNQYMTIESGSLTVSNVVDDGIQVSYESDGTDAEDTGCFTLIDGTVDVTVSGDAVKGIKADKDINIQGGSVTVTQTGKITTTDTDISYPTSLKADGDINITGGTVNITNSGEGGKGMSAEGAINISESNATTNVTIIANGSGGTVELSGSSEETSTSSYKVYISLPTGGGGFGPGGGGSTAWKNPVLYNSNGTMIASLTSTVTKSSGYSTLTFYYYDFKNADTSVNYYIKGDDYNSRGTTYTMRSSTFSAPTSGTDVYYSISNSYSTSGTVRTYSLSNVTNTYSGSTDVTEESGEGYNAIGLKSDGALTITGGTVKVSNSGKMSKSIKSKSTVTIDGGNITLTPSGEMLLNGSDASYSTGIKCVDFIQNNGILTINSSGQAGRGISATNVTTNGGTLTITNTGAGVQGSSDNYTAKCIKADTSVKLNGGTITLKASGTGGKGIKSGGTFTQGLSDGSGPLFSVTTTGSSLGSSSSGGGGWGGMGPGGQSSGGSSAKAVKVQGTATIYGGESTYSTSTDGAEGLETKQGNIDIQGGKHYFKCYDDCINTASAIIFNGGVTVCWSTGNDAIDSNYGRSGAITIGNGAVLTYTSKGSPEEGFDCDNNSYIQITGTGIGLSAGGAQGGGSSSSISGAAQGYYLNTNTMSYNTSYYYTLADANGNNLVTYKFPTSINSTLSLITAKGMVKGSKYYLTYSTTAPTDATTAFQGLYLGSSAKGTTEAKFFKNGSTSVNYFTAQ